MSTPGFKARAPLEGLLQNLAKPLQNLIFTSIRELHQETPAMGLLGGRPLPRSCPPLSARSRGSPSQWATASTKFFFYQTWLAQLYKMLTICSTRSLPSPSSDHNARKRDALQIPQITAESLGRHRKPGAKANTDNHALDLQLLLEELQASGQQQFGAGGSTTPSQASPLGPAPTRCSQPHSSTTHPTQLLWSSLPLYQVTD